MTGVWLGNLGAYSLQVAALVAAALLITRVCPIGHPAWRLRFWQALFVVAVLLPILQWPLVAEPETKAVFGSAAGFRASTPPGVPAAVLDAVRLVIAAGACVRIARLVTGWRAVRRCVRRARALDRIPLHPAQPQARAVDVRVSDDVASPATVGLRRAVILVPPCYLELPDASRACVLAHELLHVRRRDWLRMVVEEVWCALLWFHPFARVLVSRLDLAREMLIDRAVIDTTRDRRAYARALLAFSSVEAGRGAPVLPLIRRRHLSQRVAALAEEVPMSRRLSFVAFVVGCMLVGPITVSAVTFSPLRSFGRSDAAFAAPAPQDAVPPGEGVTLPRPTHVVKPEYTAQAMEAKIEGVVTLAAVVDTDGRVTRVRVTKSLDPKYGLDEAAMRAARSWRFVPGQKDGKPVAVEVAVEMSFTMRSSQ